MIDDSRQNDPVLAADPSVESLAAEVADEFTARLSRGEQPDVEEYVRRHPRLAQVLRDLLPALRVMHESGSQILSDSKPARVGNVAGETLTGCLGDYRLLREVGRGGMGIVYEAEQISLGRRVALKVLPFAAAMDTKQLERFKREAQAAAHLHHTNIVPVYSVGCERGVYYYAMQFIEGQSLADVIAEMRRLSGKDGEDPGQTGGPASNISEAVTRLVAGGSRTAPWASPGEAPTSDGQADRAQAEHGKAAKAEAGRAEHDDSPDLSGIVRRPAPPVSSPTGSYGALSTQQSLHGPGFFRSVAMLGVQAAEAIEHAHSLGIVHRDIKPANLLIDSRAHLWVTDFGLARYQADANLTRTGDMVGTLRYMSPEQALGHKTIIDHRADIYSLGATLYELLTGHPVWGGSDRRELLRQIAFDEPIPPRRWNRQIPVDLQNILLKMLAREPGERYLTAGLVAEDLRRFLEDKPVLARRPTLIDRAAKWARRHRAAVATAVVLLVFAVIALTTSNVMIAREKSRAERANQELADKQRQLQDQYAATAAALEAAARDRERAEWNFRQTREALDFMVDVAEENLARSDDLRVAEARRKILERALIAHQEFLKHAGDDLAAQQEIAESLFRIAGLFNQIDAKPDAHVAYQAAREIQERLAVEHPDDPQIQVGLLAIYRWLGVLEGRDELTFLMQESVREHLQVNAEQIALFDRLAEERRNSWNAFRGLLSPRGRGREISREDREEERQRLLVRMEEQSRAVREQIAESLTPEQSERLRQITLQLQGTQAFLSPELAAELGLTASQQQRIRDIKEEAARELREIFRQGPRRGGDREAGRDPQFLRLAANTRRTTHERLLNVLTPEQRANWLRALGEPFTGEIRFPRWGRSSPQGEAERGRSRAAESGEAPDSASEEDTGGAPQQESPPPPGINEASLF